MVEATTATHGILLECTQPRRRLARIDDPRTRAGDRSDVAACQCRDAAHVAEEVERHPFRREERPRGPRDARDDGAGRDALPIRHTRREGDPRIDRMEGRRGHRKPGDHTRAARAERRRRRRARGNRGIGREIAPRAEILGQRLFHRPRHDEARQTAFQRRIAHV